MTSRGHRWRLLGGGVLALGLLYLFFRRIEWATLRAALRAADPGWLAAIVVTTLAIYGLRAWRWGYLLAPMGRVPFGYLFSSTVIGFAAALLIPRAGELIRPYLVSRRHPIATSAGFGTIFLERVLDLVTVLVLFALYLYVLPLPSQQTHGGLLDRLRMVGALALAGALGLLAALVVFHVRAERALEILDRLFRRLPAAIGGPLRGMLASFADGLAALKAPALHLLAIAGQSLLLWLAIGVGVCVTNRAFGILLPFHASFLIISFLTVGVMIPTPGNVGGLHAAYLLSLTEPFGVEQGRAAAAAIAYHALTNLPILVLGLLFAGRGGSSMGRLADMAQSEENKR